MFVIAYPEPQIKAPKYYFQQPPADPIPVETTARGGPSQVFFLVRLRQY